MAAWRAAIITLIGVSVVAAGLAPIWVASAHGRDTDARILAVSTLIRDLGERIERMTPANEPDYKSTITTGGVTTTVTTYCDTVPPDWEGTCASYHRHKIDELKEAFP